MEEACFFKENLDVENGSQKLKEIISMKLIKKISEKIPEMENKISRNLSKMDDQRNKILTLTSEDLQAKTIHAMAREFAKNFDADIGYPSSAMTPDKLSHGAIIFRILRNWFSCNGKIWNDKQKEGEIWYLQNPSKQKQMLEVINIKQQNIRGGFNFTCPSEIVMQEVIKNELDHMIDMPKKAIAELTSQLRMSYIETSNVC